LEKIVRVLLKCHYAIPLVLQILGNIDQQRFLSALQGSLTGEAGGFFVGCFINKSTSRMSTLLFAACRR
jgi:hypothetical protein